MRSVLAVIGIVGMVWAGLSLLGMGWSGFPDGHVSPYDRTTTVWVAGVGFALLLAGIFTLVAAVMRKPRRGIVGAMLVVVLAGSLWLLDACPRLGWCATTVQQMTGVMLDDGAGG